MSTTAITTEAQRNEIKNFIQMEMLKRGFHAPIVSFEEVNGRGGNRLEFTSAPFQTTPVIFQEIVVCNFNSWLFKETHNEKEFDCFSIQIHVSYKHFGGGSNGCSLFNVSGVLADDGRSVFDFKIS